jgi:hypothetical protein
LDIVALLCDKCATGLHNVGKHGLYQHVCLEQGIVEHLEAGRILSRAVGVMAIQPSLRSGKAYILEIPLSVKIGKWGINAANGGTWGTL